MNPEKRNPSTLLIALTKLPGLSCFFLLATGLSQASLAQTEISFTAEQSTNGESLYREHCQICHGTRLSNGQFGTPLKGSYFRNNWAGKSVGELLTFTYESMPPDNKKLLPPEQYAEILAFVFENNKLEAGDSPISGDIEALGQVILPW